MVVVVVVVAGVVAVGRVWAVVRVRVGSQVWWAWLGVNVEWMGMVAVMGTWVWLRLV